MEDLLRSIAALLALPVTPTISVAVAVWLFAGLIAARFNLAGWWRRRLILERAIALERPERELALAHQRHEAELVACLVQLSFLTIGLTVATVPPLPPGRGDAWQSLLVVPLLVLVQVALAFGSWRQHRYDWRRTHLPSPPADRATDPHITTRTEGDVHDDGV